MAGGPATVNLVDWVAIFVALQELGHALAPLEDNMPRGLRRLASALPGANEKVERMCFETEHAQ